MQAELTQLLSKDLVLAELSQLPAKNSAPVEAETLLA